MRSGEQYIQVTLESADLSLLFRRLNRNGIQIRDLQIVDELTATGKIKRRDVSEAKQIADRCGDRVDARKDDSKESVLKIALKRPVLFWGIAIYIVLSLYLPTRVLFVTVEGNEHIPANYILEKAESCGIGFWESRRAVRSEKVKNLLLGEIPELQWIGVNSHGCVAVISVREKNTESEDGVQSNATSIVASRDGVISYCEVSGGNTLCRVGQAVKAGQVLVSPYTDVGLGIYKSELSAEIYALTNRELTVVSILPVRNSSESVCSESRYYLRIGKKLIKLHNDSGILGVTCGRMYSEKSMMLPGGFSLPVGLVREEVIYYTGGSSFSVEENDSAWLAQAADRYLTDKMIAGKVLASHKQTMQEEGGLRLNGEYACLEMIAQYECEECKVTDE